MAKLYGFCLSIAYYALAPSLHTESTDSLIECYSWSLYLKSSMCPTVEKRKKLPQRRDNKEDDANDPMAYHWSFERVALLSATYQELVTHDNRLMFV